MTVPSFGSGAEDVIGRDQPTAAGHVDDDDGWRAGNVAADVACDETRGRVEAAAGARADDDADGLAAVELSRRRSRRARTRPAAGNKQSPE